jgi:hypothetical protein
LVAFTALVLLLLLLPLLQCCCSAAAAAAGSGVRLAPALHAGQSLKLVRT